MKILITGTAGFIGFHLVNKLIQSDIEIIGLDSINNYYDVNLKYKRLQNTGIETNDIQYNTLIQSIKFSNYKFIQLKLEDKANIDTLFENEKFDYVVHLAAQAGVRYSITNPKEYIDSNINGFFSILENCRNHTIKHLVYASSSSVYGMNEKQPFSTQHNVDHPISLYAATKKSNELMAHTYSHLFNLPTTGLRFFTVYGPWGRPDMAYYLFTKAILENKEIEVYNNGNMFRDFTFIDDIIKGIEKIIASPAKPDTNWEAKNPNPSTSSAPYKIYNIGNNKPEKLLDFIEVIETKLGKRAIKKFMPIQDGDVVSTAANIDDLMKDFDFKPDTSIEYGLGKFIDWYKEFKK